MIYKKLYILLFCLLGFIIYGKAQDVNKILVSVAGKYNTALNLNITMTVSVFGTDKNLMYSQETELHKRRELYYTKTNAFEMLANEQAMLMVDHLSKELILSPYDIAAVKKQREIGNVNIDSLLSNADLIKEEVIDGGKKYRFSIHMSNEVIELAELIIDKKSELIEKLIYYYNTSAYQEIGKVEINYDNTDFNALSDTLVFDDKRFLYVNENNELIPMPKYHTYQIIVTDNTGKPQ